MRLSRYPCFACLASAVIFGCNSGTTSPGAGNNARWTLSPDSMNLAVLVSDYLSFEFEMGTLDYYPPCVSCDENGLPFNMIYHATGDFGDVTFEYTVTKDTLFYGTVIWMGHGAIGYPLEFHDAGEFERLADSPKDPLSVEYFWEYPPTYEEEFKAKADTAWQHVKTLDIVAEFAKAEYRVGIYMYPPVQGVFDPNAAKWIIFLYRGRQSTLPLHD